MNCAFSRSLDAGPVMRRDKLDERIERRHLLKGPPKNFRASLRPLDTAIFHVDQPGSGVTALLRLRERIRVFAQRTQSGAEANSPTAKTVEEVDDEKANAENKRNTNQNSGRKI